MPPKAKVDAVAGLIEACINNRGRLVLTEDQVANFTILIKKKGGRHAIRNFRLADGTFKNQAILAQKPGVFLCFEIYPRQPLHA